MKVILLQELKGRGGEGDVVDVARGFAVNYLLPRKIAIEATKGNLKQLEQRSHNIQKREDQRLTDAERSRCQARTARPSRSRPRSAKRAVCSARSPTP